MKSGHLLHCEIEGQHSELTLVSGDKLGQLRAFCWHMAEKYKRTSSVRDVFINNMKGKLGEEVVKARLANLVTEIDYEKRLSGDGKVVFTLTSDSSVGIQVKATYGSIDTVQWWITKEEVEKNTVLVCILIKEEVNEAQPEYSLIMSGFILTNMIQVTHNTTSIGIDLLLYGGGLHSYLSSLYSNFRDEEQDNETQESKPYCKSNYQQTQEEYIESQIISLIIDYFILANVCLAKNDYHGAFVNFNQVLQLNPNISEAYLHRSYARSIMGDIQGATDDLNIAILINPVDYQLYFNRGSFRYDIGDIQGAIEDFNQGIKINPNNAYAFFKRANFLWEIGDNEAAIEDYTQSLRINPKFAEAYLNRGLLRYSIRDTQNAIEDFTQTISINPKFIEAYYWRGAARYDRRIDKGAIVDFTQVIKLNHKDCSAYVRRGIVFDAVGEYQKAIEDFEQALMINPDYAEAYENRGGVYYQLGHMEYAIRDLQKAANFYQKHGKDEDYQRAVDMLRNIMNH